MHECIMHRHHLYSGLGINRKGCQSCLWSEAEQGKCIFLCPRSRLRIGSRETGSAVPPRANPLFSTPRLNLVLTRGLLPFLPLSAIKTMTAKASIYTEPSLGQSRVYRVAQLRTGGVYCTTEKSASTRPSSRRGNPKDQLIPPTRNLSTPTNSALVKTPQYFCRAPLTLDPTVSFCSLLTDSGQ